MTGFGKAETPFRGHKLICEIRSLNSKSMDLSVRLAAPLRAHEWELRTIVNQRLERGKVDLAIYEDSETKDSDAGYTPVNWEVAKIYAEQYKTQFACDAVPEAVMAAILRFPDVLKIQEDTLKKLSGDGKKICVNMGNDYAVPYCSLVTNMDLRGSEYTILDECVPFFQLAMHGRVNYTGDPINIGGNEEEEILYAAEYGAGLYFTLMRESAFALQKTLYTEYYGSSYDAWRDEMLGIYSRYNEELGHTFNQEMTDHANLTGTLSVTVYEDGTRVYVNYGYSEQKAEGVSVPARDYLVVRK